MQFGQYHALSGFDGFDGHRKRQEGRSYIKCTTATTTIRTPGAQDRISKNIPTRCWKLHFEKCPYRWRDNVATNINQSTLETRVGISRLGNPPGTAFTLILSKKEDINFNQVRGTSIREVVHLTALRGGLAAHFTPIITPHKYCRRSNTYVISGQ